MRTIEVSLQIDCAEGSEQAVQALFQALDDYPVLAIPAGDLSIALMDEASLAAIHGRFLEDDSPTDVITFPGNQHATLAGEICVSVERARAQAPEHGHSAAYELSLYLVHGWLHLAGLDDHEADERARMREAEQAVLAWLKQRGAILEQV